MWERDAALCVLLAVGVELLCCLDLGEASPGISFPIVLLLFPIAERCAGRCWLRGVEGALAGAECVAVGCPTSLTEMVGATRPMISLVASWVSRSYRRTSSIVMPAEHTWAHSHLWHPPQCPPAP